MRVRHVAANQQGAKLARHFAFKMASAGITDKSNVAVALSGGADSLSLALALSWWSGTSGTVPTEVHAAMRQDTKAPPLKLEHHLSVSQYTQHLVSTLGVKQLRLCEQPVQQKPTVAAFCVDHQLRPESAQECQQAANRASTMGLGSLVVQMHWPELPASGHLMEQASIMRYQLLQQVCKANHISVLLTGHHAGDQAETFMMRVTRGSGISGLAGIAEASWASLDTDHPLLLVRPFLELPKWQLEAACTEQGLTWADDPTNLDTTYLRNHLRALLSKPVSGHQAKQEVLESNSELSTQRSSHNSHQLPGLDKNTQQPDKANSLSSTQPGADSLSNAECVGGIVPAILQVQRRCAAAHSALSAAAKDLVQASLQLPDRPRQQQKSHQHESLAQQEVSGWTLAVQPFAAAQSDVALHALTAVMQAVSSRNKQPRLSIVKNLLKRLKPGHLRGSFVANDCTISPVLFSKGLYMTVRPLPVMSANNARRRQ